MTDEEDLRQNTARLLGDPAALAREVARLKLSQMRDSEGASILEDRIVDLERAHVTLVISTLRRVADVLGLADDDITAGLLDQARLLRHAARQEAAVRNSQDVPLADDLEKAARDLPAR